MTKFGGVTVVPLRDCVRVFVSFTPTLLSKRRRFMLTLMDSATRYKRSWQQTACQYCLLSPWTERFWLSLDLGHVITWRGIVPKDPMLIISSNTQPLCLQIVLDLIQSRVFLLLLGWLYQNRQVAMPNIPWVTVMGYILFSDVMPSVSSSFSDMNTFPDIFPSCVSVSSQYYDPDLAWIRKREISLPWSHGYFNSVNNSISCSCAAENRPT